MKFSDVFEDQTKYGTKIKTDEYKEKGKHAIVDQGKKLIAGYTDLEDGLYNNVPAIIFGDHTRVIKYIDVPFFLGADGTKILKCKVENANYKYLYYALTREKIPDTGYNRHFKWLKEIDIKYPSVDKQDNIVKKLDKLSSIIQKRQQQLDKLDELVKARFVETFGDVVSNTKNWKTYTWNDVLVIKNGKNQKNVENNKGIYPICGSGGIMSYADDYITESNSVIIGRKGNINNPILMREKFWNVDTAFGLEPNTTILNVDYLFMFCSFFDFEVLNKAVTIPSLTKADLLRIIIPIPPIELQNQFADFVKQIDKSKVAVQKALDEAQLLFDSLMQEYFG